MSRYGYSSFPEYVSVAQRRENAQKLAKKLEKQGHTLNPVVIEGRTIAKTFWGKSWCAHLESFSDYESRLPRGRTYVRNGSVIDLKINPGEIKAMVSGSEIYNVSIKIDALPESKWKALVDQCSGKIESLIELLQGKFSKGVMEIITKKQDGMFPDPKEIKLKCSCPDYAEMCKHVAAVLYGIGNRLDKNPEYLFNLRQTNHMDLINNTQLGSLSIGIDDTQLDGDLSTLFGIEFADQPSNIDVQKPKKTKQQAIEIITPKVIKGKIVKSKPKSKAKLVVVNPKPVKSKTKINTSQKKKVTEE